MDYNVIEDKFKDSKKKIENLSSEIVEKDNLIVILKTEVKVKEDISNNYGEEIESIKYQNEKLKSELNILKGDTSKKDEKYTDIKSKYSELEQEYIDYKHKINSELNNLREFKQLYETLKISHYDIKNQYELLQLKHQTISDENYNLKRDLLLYDKENKNKSDMIERLRSDMIDKRRDYSFDISNNKTKEYNSINNFNSNYETKNSDPKNLEQRILNMNLEREKVFMNKNSLLMI